jgi:transcriptional regulator with XRE-family HTH domain
MPKRIRDMPEEYLTTQELLAREIGARIRAKRDKLKLTQEQLRTRLEFEQIIITRTQYSRIEKGKTLPNAAQIIALRTIFGVSADWLLTGEEHRSP